jgi:hypothetical protein
MVNYARRRMTEDAPRLAVRRADVQVRGIEWSLWVELRATATLRRQTLGALLSEILHEWLARHGTAER